jgi:hypothetical protein
MQVEVDCEGEKMDAIAFVADALIESFSLEVGSLLQSSFKTKLLKSFVSNETRFNRLVIPLIPYYSDTFFNQQLPTK